VLFLHYYADLDYETIGRVLEIAPGTVGKLLHDARATLRRALDGGSDA
jgi:DNA-directed RNA polymerase specialized sigma24 family protein